MLTLPRDATPISHQSVRPSVTLRNRGHIGSKTISWLISLGCSLCITPNNNSDPITVSCALRHSLLSWLWLFLFLGYNWLISLFAYKWFKTIFGYSDVQIKGDNDAISVLLRRYPTTDSTADHYSSRQSWCGRILRQISTNSWRHSRCSAIRGDSSRLSSV